MSDLGQYSNVVMCTVTSRGRSDMLLGHKKNPPQTRTQSFKQTLSLNIINNTITIVQLKQVIAKIGTPFFCNYKLETMEE